MSKSQGDLIESRVHTEFGRRDFLIRIMKVSSTGAVVALIPSAIITRALAAAAPNQNEWRQCKKCSSLFYDGYRSKGRCPAAGGHVADVYHDYLLTYDSAGPGQRDWRFCNKCETLFFDGYPNKGVCMGGGGHVAAGFNFTLRYPARGRQFDYWSFDWRFCNKCETLFFDGERSKGACAAGGGHVAAGYHFALESKRSPIDPP